jgi:cell division protein FtsB
MNLASFKKNYLTYILILSFVAVLLFAWLSFGRHGLADLYKMQKEKERYLFIITVARKELGMIKENEIIYRFKRGQEANKDNDNRR